MKTSALRTVVSATNKLENQDACGIGMDGSHAIMILADGVGSYTYARESSQRVLEFALEYASDAKLEDLDMDHFFQAIHGDLMTYAHSFLEQNPNSSEAPMFGTTLLCCLDLEHSYRIGYVGNGSIFHFRGNFNSFPESFPFSWNIINYLNPHSVWQDGKEALFRLMSTEEYGVTPTVLEIQKDAEYGDLIVLCTDGIHSNDQLRYGTNNAGTWIKQNPFLTGLASSLEHFLQEPQAWDSDTLQLCISDYLREIQPKLEDDATLGVILSPNILEYQKTLRLVPHEND